jgi:ABC-type transporter Mla subunit MlaD
MDENTITDLKQFITATVSQQTIELEQKLDDKLGALEGRLTQKIDDLSSAVAEAIETNTTEIDARLDNHEKRLRKLERQPA